MSKVLLLCLDTFGDQVLRQPLFKGLLDSGNDVTVLVREGYEQILPFCDRRLKWITTPLNPHLPPPADLEMLFKDLMDRLKENSYDVVVCCPFQRTYLDEWIMREFPRAQRVGFNSGRLPIPRGLPRERQQSSALELLWTEVVDCDELEHDVEKNKRLLSVLKGNKPTNYPPPRLRVPKPIYQQSLELLHALDLEENQFVLCLPGGVRNVRIKRWPSEHFAEVALHLHKNYGLPTLFVGDKGEQDILKHCQASCLESGLSAHIWAGSPQEIGLLLGLLRASRMYLGNDAGPMHMAAALGRPVVALFGGGHWPRFLPLSEHGIVLTQKLPCFYCHWNCIFGDALCITMVSVEACLHAVDQILSNQVNGVTIDSGRPLEAWTEHLVQLSLGVIRDLEADRMPPIDHITFLAKALVESELDRAARLEVIQGLEEDRAAYQEAVKRLEKQLDESELDRVARLEVIQGLERDRAAYQEAVERLEEQLHKSEADRSARLEVIQGLERDRVARLEVIEGLEGQLGAIYQTRVWRLRSWLLRILGSSKGGIGT